MVKKDEPKEPKYNLSRKEALELAVKHFEVNRGENVLTIAENFYKFLTKQ